MAVLDMWGNIVERYSYDAFGKAKIMSWWDNNERGTSWINNRFMFQGREWIAELGIYDYRHRMYSPELGRFLQTDPTDFGAGDMNLFRYCGDDPVDGSDPTGLISWNAGAGLTSWGNGDWMANGGFNNDLVAAYQKIRDAVVNFFSGDKHAAERSENGSLRVQSARVNLTHRTLGYHNSDDDRGGYTPNPLETKGGVSTTSVQASPGNLALTYNLEIQTRLNLSRGAKTRLWAKLKEPDHWNDFHNADARFQGAAGTLVGQRFNSEAAAQKGLRGAVDPVVGEVYRESKRDWDDSGLHRPRDLRTLQPVGPNE
jgi:RHS repeat-associated protein